MISMKWSDETPDHRVNHHDRKEAIMGTRRAAIAQICTAIIFAMLCSSVTLGTATTGFA